MSTDSSWKKLSTTELLKHPRVPVIEDTVQLPNGTQTHYARIPASDAVTVMMRRADGAFLLNLEYRYATDERLHHSQNQPKNANPHNGMLLHFPGGAINDDETPEAACLREVAEETGIDLAGTPKLLMASVFNYFPRMVSRDYKYFINLPHEYRQGQTNREATEAGMRQLWLSEDDIDQLIRDGDQRILHSHVLDCWALYKVQKTLLAT